MDNNRHILQNNPLRIGISTRALFDLEKEHEVFCQQGVDAYSKMQRERENNILAMGAGFSVVERLLDLNMKGEKPFVEVILMSRNSPDLSLRAFKSIEHYGLDIKSGSFTSGRSLTPYIPAWGIDLFLSNDNEDVAAAVSVGVAAAKLGLRPKTIDDVSAHDKATALGGNHAEVRAAFDGDHSEVRIAFDGDAVVFSEESDNIYKTQGIEAFLQHERANATNPMKAGPFGKFLQKLSLLRTIYLDKEDVSRVRIIIVTARNAPAHERVVHTLRAWGTPADEAHFVGAHSKAPILEAAHAHIFFDDQEKHILSASAVVPSGHVPGPHDANTPIIPASPNGMKPHKNI